MRNFILNLFFKSLLKSMKYSRSLLDTENYRVAISSHIMSFRFLPISGHFLTTQGNQNQSIGSRKISCSRLSQKEKFLEPIEKNSHFVSFTGEPVSAIMSTTLFQWSQRFTYFFFIFSFVIDNAKPTCLDCVSNNIYRAFNYCWIYIEHSVWWVRCAVVYIWY